MQNRAESGYGKSGTTDDMTASDRSAAVRTGLLPEAKLYGRQTLSSSPATTAQESVPRPGGYRSLAGLLCGYALLIVGNGLFQTLIPLRILQSGYSTVVVGLVQSCYYAGFIAGSFINRPLIDRIGQHRAFVAFSAGAAILAIAFGFGHSPFALAFIRLLSGFAFVGLYTSIESWINGTVENERRGQAFGAYAGINYLAVGTGQLLLNVGDSSGAQQLSLVAALFAAAVLPVTLMEGWPVRVADESLKRVPVKTWKASIQQMMSATPLAVPGCVLAGLLYSSFYAITPVYLARTGFSREALSTFMAVA